MRLRSALLAALAAAPLTARAQAPAVPPPVAPGYPADYFTQIASAYNFSGCATGPVALGPGGTYVTGTAYCVSGLLTLGTSARRPAGLGLVGYLDLAAAGDARLRATPSAEFADVQTVRGVLTGGLLGGGACPVGCVRDVNFSGAGGAPGRQSWAEILSTDPAATFVPQTVTVNLGYPDPAGGGRLGVQATFALTAVPEPSTFALGAAGLVAVGAAARRRRRPA
jgi:hypothetical protein